VAASVLHAAGLPELVTTSLDDYEGSALKLASNPALLQSLRQRLQHNRLSCPLFRHGPLLPPSGSGVRDNVGHLVPRRRAARGSASKNRSDTPPGAYIGAPCG